MYVSLMDAAVDFLFIFFVFPYLYHFDLGQFHHYAIPHTPECH